MFVKSVEVRARQATTRGTPSDVRLGHWQSVGLETDNPQDVADVDRFVCQCIRALGARYELFNVLLRSETGGPVTMRYDVGPDGRRV